MSCKTIQKFLEGKIGETVDRMTDLDMSPVIGHVGQPVAQLITTSGVTMPQITEVVRHLA